MAFLKDHWMILSPGTYRGEIEFNTPEKIGLRLENSSDVPLASANSIYRLADKVICRVLLSPQELQA